MQTNQWIKWLLVVTATVMMTACGGGDAGNGNGNGSGSGSGNNKTHVLLDAPIAGVTYICKEPSGEQMTNAKGEFTCDEGPVTFKIGGLVLGTVNDLNSGEVWPQDLLGLPRNNLTDMKLIAMMRLLQSLDNDGNISESINITSEMSEKFEGVDEPFDASHLDQYAAYAGEVGIPLSLVDEADAINHFKDSLLAYYKSKYVFVDYTDIPLNHNLDGQTIYFTRCKYIIKDINDKGKDRIEGILPYETQAFGVTLAVPPGITVMELENGLISIGSIDENGNLDMGSDVLPSQTRYYSDNNFFSAVVVAEVAADSYLSAELYFFAGFSSGGKYYVDIVNYEPDWVVAFHDTKESADTYIQQVFSKKQRTCMVK